MSEVLYSAKFLQLKSTKRENGSEWFYAHRPNAKDIAIIVPVIKKQDREEILFLITKRPPIMAENRGDYCLELPAGLVGDIDKNEDIMDALKRELKEETGLIADEIKIVSRKIASSSGLTSETSTIAIAHINDLNPKNTPDDDNGVIIERKLVPREEVFNFVKEFESKGNVVGAQTLSGLFYYFFEK